MNAGMASVTRDSGMDGPAHKKILCAIVMGAAFQNFGSSFLSNARNFLMITIG